MLLIESCRSQSYTVLPNPVRYITHTIFEPFEFCLGCKRHRSDQDQILPGPTVAFTTAGSAGGIPLTGKELTE